jgi:threonine/homoserine/homoserine lactone efflux protein
MAHGHRHLLGLFVHALLSALGVSAVIAHSATAFLALKVAGAGYLAWLGLQSLQRAVRGAVHADGRQRRRRARAGAALLSRGLLTNCEPEGDRLLLRAAAAIPRARDACS